MTTNSRRMVAGGHEQEGITFVCATRDRVEEVGRLMESLSLQTHPGFELILVDQNDDDRLGPLVRQYESRYRIERICIENIGIAAARNLALPRAGFGWIGFPDDDCWFPTDFTQRFLSLDAGREADGIFVNWCDPGNGSMNAFTFSGGRMTFKEGFHLVASICLFVRTRVLISSGGFNEKFGLGPKTIVKAGEDQELTLRLLANSAVIEKVPELNVFHPIGHRAWDSAFLKRIQSQGACDVYFKRKYDGVLMSWATILHWLAALVFNACRFRKRNLQWYSHKLYGALRYGQRL